jgi:NADPH2:quinone reductase
VSAQVKERAMQVEQMREQGGIDNLSPAERPKPTPGAGQAVVEVRSAGVGPWDLSLMGGGLGPVPLPFVPGLEVAGVVDSVGDGVDFRPGDQVYAATGLGGGGFAEYSLVSADKMAGKPARASFDEAAGLVVGAGTAYEGLVDRTRLKAGESVLITAAGGGVGSAAVQIAAAIGARVVGLASPMHHDYVRGLGASATFDYHDAEWVQQVRAMVPDGVDVLFDDFGGETRDRALGAVRDGGRAVFLAGPPARLERGITGESFSADVNRARLEAVGRLVDEGKLRPEVEDVLPLAQAREALERVASRHTRGKIVLQVAP